MGALKAVPAESVDLSEFTTVVAKGEDRWRQVLEQLGADDVRKLRAALVEPRISPNAIKAWLEVRGVSIHGVTVSKWRAKGYAEDA